VKRRIDDTRRVRARAAAEGGSEGDGDPRVAAFLRGVTIGALVGAAIAGSALWERAVRRRAATASDTPASHATASDAVAAGDGPPPF
jgi:hypothetical protein